MRMWLLLGLCFISFALRAQELTFLIIKSPGINWNSPRALAKSTVDGANESFGLGHVSVMLSCGGEEIFTGIANRYASETRDAVLKEGNGLGVLFRLFEGSLESGKFTRSNFERLAKAGRGNFLTFKISSTTCARLVEYERRYDELQVQRRARGEKLYYGFPALARLGEGAGCSGFAMSFLEVAGLRASWMRQQWSRELRVPKSDVGYPVRAHHVGLRHMLYSSSQRWAREGEAHFPLFFWDPDLMFKHVSRLLESGEEERGERFGAPGIIMDLSSVATPSEDLFWQDVSGPPAPPSEIYQTSELERRWDLSRRP